MSARPSLRDRLREATRPEHERLESGLDLAGPGLDVARYRRVLGLFHGFWAAWEPRVAAAIADAAFTAPRLRLDRLRDDLLALGEDPDALPVAPAPEIRGRGEAMGALYVMEGSTLGGRIILKRAEGLGLPPEATGYFAGHGAETGPMWKRFVARLEAEPDEDAVIRGARAAFAGLEAWALGGRAA